MALEWTRCGDEGVWPRKGPVVEKRKKILLLLLLLVVVVVVLLLLLQYPLPSVNKAYCRRGGKLLFCTLSLSSNIH